MDLAKSDPEQFESKRMEAIDRLIESMPEERKIHLRRLQWRVDRVREGAGNPMAATIAISRMMWDAFYNLRDHYQELFADYTGGKREPRSVKTAQIIAFRPQTVEA